MAFMDSRVTGSPAAEYEYDVLDDDFCSLFTGQLENQMREDQPIENVDGQEAAGTDESQDRATKKSKTPPLFRKRQVQRANGQLDVMVYDWNPDYPVSRRWPNPLKLHSQSQFILQKELTEDIKQNIQFVFFPFHSKFGDCPAKDDHQKFFQEHEFDWSNDKVSWNQSITSCCILERRGDAFYHVCKMDYDKLAHLLFRNTVASEEVSANRCCPEIAKFEFKGKKKIN